MTIDVIAQGASRDYTATVRFQTFVVSNNSGQYGHVTNYKVEGIPQPDENIGPQPERVSLGPFLIGDTFRVTCDIGQLLVEYDNLVSGGDVSQAEFDSLSGVVSGHSSSISSLQSSQTAQDVTIGGLSSSVGTLSSSVSTLSGTVSTLSGTVSTLSSSVTTVEADVTTITNIVDGIDDTVSGVTGDGATDNGPAFNAALGLTGTFVSDNKVVARVPTGGFYVSKQLIDVHPSVSLNFKSRGGIVLVPDGDISSANSDKAQGALVRIPRRTPASSATLAWGFSLSGVNLDARGVTFASKAFTVVAATDIFTSTAHGRPNGYGLYLSGSPLPAGLSASTLYIVTNATTDTFQLTDQAGTPVNVTANGSGTWYTSIHGLRVPNADPSNNSLDPDPTFAGNKDYVAGRYEFGDVIGFPGSGVLLESTNGRADIHSFRALNNGGNGFDLGGNDIVMSAHWAVGGNNLFGLKVGNASGFFATTGNLWGSSALRSLQCGAAWINQRKLFGLAVCEFNDWLRMDGGASYWRGGVVALNCFAPFNENFNGEGTAIDVTSGGADLRLQAHIGIVDYQSANFIGNQYFRTTATNKVTQPGGAFGSWQNVGGDLAGNFGTAFRWFIDASSNAMVNTIDTVSTAPNVKGWTGPTAVISAVTAAAPGVFTSVAHGLTTDQRIVLTSSGSVPGGTFAGVTYFAIVIDADTFQIANIPGQTTGLTTTSAGSGTIKFGVQDSLPYNTRGGGQVNYLLQNSFNCETRIGARGPAHSKLLLGIADTDFGVHKGITATFLPAAVDTVGNKITSAAHGMKDGYPIVFTTTTTLPSGLSSSQQYWTINTTTNDFQVTALPGGSVVALGSIGTGTHTYYSWYRIYAIEAGDRTIPSSTNYRHALHGLWEFGKGEQYQDSAWVRNSYSGGTFAATVGIGTRTRLISLSGGTFSTGSVTIPTDLNASQFLDIVIWGQNVTAFSLAVTGSGTINASTLPVPASIQGQFLSMRLFYERDTNRWDVLAVNQAAISDISAKIGSGAAVSLTTNTIANLTSIVLTPGIWDLTGVVIFTSTNAATTPSVVSAAISSANSTIPATDATAYAKRLLNLGAVASGTDYDTLNMGVNRVSVAAGTTTTMYLNARSTFSNTATAFGAIRAVPVAG
jgi:hypothetical protein